MTDIRTNIKNDEFKAILSETFKNRKNWNRRININGYEFIYSPVDNMGRVVDKRSNECPFGTKHLPVFCWAFGTFMWTC